MLERESRVVWVGVDAEEVTVRASKSGLHMASNASAGDVCVRASREWSAGSHRMVNRRQDGIRQLVTLIAGSCDRLAICSCDRALMRIVAASTSEIIRGICDGFTELTCVSAVEGDGKIRGVLCGLSERAAKARMGAIREGLAGFVIDVGLVNPLILTV